MDTTRHAETEVEVIESIDDALREELEAFFSSLSDELVSVATTFDEVLRSELLITARTDGRLIGLFGIVRRFAFLPCGYYIVRREYQSRGVAKALLHALRPYTKSYLGIYGVIRSRNERMAAWLAQRNQLLVHDDGEYKIFLCQAGPAGRAWVKVLRLILPPMVALYRLVKKLRGPGRAGRSRGR